MRKSGSSMWIHVGWKKHSNKTVAMVRKAGENGENFEVLVDGCLTHIPLNNFGRFALPQANLLAQSIRFRRVVESAKELKPVTYRWHFLKLPT